MFDWLKQREKDKLLLKGEVAYRQGVKRTTNTRFPPPKGASRSGAVEVSNLLGRAYYNNELPAWVLWNPKDPESIYLNVNMIMRLFSDLLGYKLYEADKAQVDLLCGIAESVLRDKILGEKYPKHKNSTDIKRHYKTDTFTLDFIEDTNYKYWTTKEQLEYLINFKMELK